MVSKNNQKLAQSLHADQRQRFTVRKLGIGVVSVLIGAVLAGGTFVAQASADSTGSGDQAQPTTPNNLATDSTVSLTNSSANSAATTALPTSGDQGSSAADQPVAATTADSPAPTNQNVVTVASPIYAVPTDSPLSQKDSAGVDLAISQNTVGNDGTTNGITITFNGNFKAGDVYTLTIPDGPSYGLDIQGIGKLTSDLGATIQSRQNNATTLTYQFKMDAAVIFRLNLTRENGYRSQPLLTLGTHTKEITWTSQRNGASAPTTNQALKFYEIIKPSMDPKPAERVTPPMETGIEGVYPNTDYTYRFQVNESSGVANDGRASAEVNSAIGNGTTITIPVPEGFVLNEKMTQEKNPYGDKTTIAQPGGKGHDIIITVPTGSGRQNWNNRGGYLLVGHFDLPTPETDTVYTAKDNPLASNQGQPIVDQAVLTTNGDGKFIGTTTPWSIKLLSGKNVPTDGSVGIEATGNSGDNQLLLDNDDSNNPAIVNDFGFTLKSNRAYDNLPITLDLADGLHVTGIKTPVDPLNMAGTTEYHYTLTLTDGSQVTGTVKAGEAVTDSSGKGIRKAVFTPNYLMPGATTDTYLRYKLGGDFGPTKQNNQLIAFLAYGYLAHQYDNGNPVKRGDQLISKISIQAPKLAGSKIVYAEAKQRVIGEEDLQAAMSASLGQNNVTNPDMPGTADAGRMALGGPGTAYSTDQLYEPIFYYVLPQYTSWDSVKGIVNLQGGVEPKVTTYMWGNRQVVKIDYTGTKYYYKTNANLASGTAMLYINNDADAYAGSSQWEAYVYSPRTPLSNTVAKLDDRSFVDNHADHLYLLGNGNWQINVPSAYYIPSMSQGNENERPVQQGTSDDKKAPDMTYYVSVANYSDHALEDGHLLINLPRATDAGKFNFYLTQAIGSEKNGTVEMKDLTILYSTEPQVFTSQEAGAQVSTAGYVTADKVSDWKAIRSIIVTLPTLPADQQIGRFVLKGQAPDVTYQAGKRGPLDSVLTSKALQPFRSDVTSIQIVGTSTVTARYHYVDAAGKEHFIDLPMLTKTYQDNVDTMQQTDFTLTDAAKALIPANYELATEVPTIVNGAQSWVTTAANETAAFGQTVRYYFDGDIVQFELVHQHRQTPKTITKTVNYYYTTVNGPVAHEALVQTVTITEDEDLVTGEKTYFIDGQAVPNQGATTLAGQALPVLPGYTADVLDGRDADATGATAVDYNSNDLTINVVYTANDQAATFIYHDDTTGQDLLCVKQTGPSNQLINYLTKDQLATYAAAGYVLVSDDTKGQPVYFDHDDKVDQTYVIHLKHGTESTTRRKQITQSIHYVDSTGQPMKDAQGQQLPDDVQKVNLSQTGVKDLVTDTVDWNGEWTTGSYQLVTSPTVPGYSPNQDQVTGTTVTTSNELVAKNQDTLVVITYAPDEESVTVRYQTADGTPLASSETQTGSYGSDYTTSAKEITGYHLVKVPTNATGTYTTDTPDVIYVYAPDEETVTVRYQTADGTPLASSETQTGSYGSDYTTSAKEIPGYHLTTTPTNAKGTYTADTPDVIYVYAPDEESVTVHYQTADGTTVAPSETQTGSYGSDYTTSAKEITGYHLVKVPTNATGTYTTDTPDVIYVYAPDEESVTVHYQTADGTALAPSETLRGEYGGSYTTQAKEINGYRLVAIPANATGTYTANTPDVIYVYVPTHKVEINEPTDPGTPSTPSTDQPASPQGTSAEPLSSAARLPQTGNDAATADWQVALGSLLGSLSLLALAKRKREQ